MPGPYLSQSNASLLFDPDENEETILFAKEHWPAELPTLNRALRKIAKIGDYFGRKGEGERGVETSGKRREDAKVTAFDIQSLGDEERDMCVNL